MKNKILIIAIFFFLFSGLSSLNGQTKFLLQNDFIVAENEVK